MARWGRSGAGVLFVTEDDSQVLLLLRSRDVYEGGTWGIPGGRIDHEETPWHAARREVKEECGGFPHRYQILDTRIFTEPDFEYTTFIVAVPDQFVPELDWESGDFTWTSPSDPPTPLHPGVQWLFEQNLFDLARRS